MKTGMDGNEVVLKLEQGEDFLATLVKGLGELGVTSGVVLSGIGALKDFELGWFDPDIREYARHRYQGSHELLSLQGTVTLESQPQVHVHASVANKDNQVFGGHLFEGIVAVLAEVSVLKLKGLHLTREMNPRTQLKELTIHTR